MTAQDGPWQYMIDGGNNLFVLKDLSRPLHTGFNKQSSAILAKELRGNRVQIYVDEGFEFNEPFIPYMHRGFKLSDLRDPSGNQPASVADVIDWFRDNTGESVGGGGGSGGITTGQLNASQDAQDADIAATYATKEQMVAIVRAGKYKKVAILGASIMEYSFGDSGSEIKTDATQIFKDKGLDVDVYSYAIAGSDFSDVLSQITTAFSQHPDSTLFFFHIGGNNVSPIRPYSSATEQELSDFVSDMNDVFSAIEARKKDCVFSSITFRAYGDPTTSTAVYNDHSLGSGPFNDNLLIPKIREELPWTINTDGRPIVDLYGLTFNRSEYWMATDGIHGRGSEGARFIIESVADRLGYFVNNSGLPDTVELVKDDIIICMGEGNTQLNGHNLITVGEIGAGSINFLTVGGASTGISLSVTTNGSVTSNQVWRNTAGGDLGDSFFNRSLINDNVYNSSLFTYPGYQITYTFSGLEPDGYYKMGFAASRVAEDERTTRIEANGSVVLLRTSPSIPDSPKYLVAEADSFGNITVTQSVEAGGFSYLGGISISANPLFSHPYKLNVTDDSLELEGANSIPLTELTKNITNQTIGTTAERPASPRPNDMHFDTTLGYPVWYDGTNWVDATGTTR